MLPHIVSGDGAARLRDFLFRELFQTDPLRSRDLFRNSPTLWSWFKGIVTVNKTPQQVFSRLTDHSVLTSLIEGLGPQTEIHWTSVPGKEEFATSRAVRREKRTCLLFQPTNPGNRSAHLETGDPALQDVQPDLWKQWRWEWEWKLARYWSIEMK